MKDIAVSSDIQLDVVYTLENFILNKLSWRLFLDTPQVLATELIELACTKTAEEKMKVVNFVMVEFYELFKYIHFEYNTYKKYDSFTWTLVCLLFILSIHNYSQEEENLTLITREISNESEKMRLESCFDLLQEIYNNLNNEDYKELDLDQESSTLQTPTRRFENFHLCGDTGTTEKERSAEKEGFADLNKYLLTPVPLKSTFMDMERDSEKFQMSENKQLAQYSSQNKGKSQVKAQYAGNQYGSGNMLNFQNKPIYFPEGEITKNEDCVRKNLNSKYNELVIAPKDSFNSDLLGINKSKSHNISILTDSKHDDGKFIYQKESTEFPASICKSSEISTQKLNIINKLESTPFIQSNKFSTESNLNHSFSQMSYNQQYNNNSFTDSEITQSNECKTLSILKVMKKKSCKSFYLKKQEKIKEECASLDSIEEEKDDRRNSTVIYSTTRSRLKKSEKKKRKQH